MRDNFRQGQPRPTDKARSASISSYAAVIGGFRTRLLDHCLGNFKEVRFPRHCGAGDVPQKVLPLDKAEADAAISKTVYLEHSCS